MKIIKIVLILVFVQALSSCSNLGKDPVNNVNKKTTINTTDIVELTQEQIINAGVITGVIEKKMLKKMLKVSGMLEAPPQNMVSICVTMGGYIKNSDVIQGAKIRKGQTLAILEDQQYIQLQQEYLMSKNRLLFLETDFVRQQKLNDTKTSSDKVFQQAKNDFYGQQILLKSLGEKLQLIGIDPLNLNENNVSRSIRISSPINGYVTKVNVNNGKYVTPTDVLFECINPENVHLTLTVFENDAAELEVGQNVKFFTNKHPENKFNATIHLLNPSINKDRTTEVHCDIAGNDKNLLPGMYVNAEIELKKVETTCVPEEAIAKWENKSYVFLEMGNGKFKMEQVQTGNSDDGFIELLSELPNRKIIIKNAYTLLSKIKNKGEE